MTKYLIKFGWRADWGEILICGSGGERAAVEFKLRGGKRSKSDQQQSFLLLMLIFEINICGLAKPTVILFQRKQNREAVPNLSDVLNLKML